MCMSFWYGVNSVYFHDRLSISCKLIKIMSIGPIIWARLKQTVQLKFEIVKKMKFIVGDCTIRVPAAVRYEFI